MPKAGPSSWNRKGRRAFAREQAALNEKKEACDRELAAASELTTSLSEHIAAAKSVEEVAKGHVCSLKMDLELADLWQQKNLCLVSTHASQSDVFVSMRTMRRSSWS